MNFKFSKSIIFFIIASLILSITLPNNAAATSNINLREDKGLSEVFEDVLSEENIDLLSLEYTADNVNFEVATFDKSKQSTEDSTIEIEIEPGSEIIHITQQTEEYTVNIDSLDENGLIATYTNVETGQAYYYDSTIATPSFAFAIPWGISLSAKAISALYAVGAVAILGGIAYIEVNNFIKNEKKKYNHYIAVITNDKLHIGGGLSKSKATSRLKSKKNTWSTSKSNAQSLAKGASPIGKVTAPEVSKGKNMVWHYHPVTGYDKNGKSIRMEKSHAFYGSAN